jgi:D-threo-aldose 1-dehydrogenase
VGDGWTPGRVGLGGADLGNLHAPMSDAQAHALLTAAWDGGIRAFDTAPHYGLGLSERRLGGFLADRPRDQAVVSTKVGRLLRPLPGDTRLDDRSAGFAVPADHERVWDFSRAGVRRSIEGSLDRLGLDRIDLTYLHDPDEAPDPDRALRDGTESLLLRDEGVVDRIGVGSKSVRTLVAAARTGMFDVVMAAGRLTVLEWADEIPRACLCTRTGIVAAGVFNSGLSARVRPERGARYEYAEASDELVARARVLADQCLAAGTELPTVALQWPLRHPAVTGLVLGAADPDQLRENLERLVTPVPDGLWERLVGGPR